MEATHAITSAQDAEAKAKQERVIGLVGVGRVHVRVEDDQGLDVERSLRAQAAGDDSSDSVSAT